jgi:hypothetical protein
MFDGGELITGYSAEELQAAVSAGFAFSVEPRDIDIIVVAQGVAVAVVIIEGSITLPGGVVQEGVWRYSETRLKEGGVKKVIQYHFSPATVAPIGDIK